MNSWRETILNLKSIIVIFVTVLFIFSFFGCASTGRTVKEEPEQEIFIDEEGVEYVIEYVDEEAVEELALEDFEEGEIIVLDEAVGEIMFYEEEQAEETQEKEAEYGGFAEEEQPEMIEKAFQMPLGGKEHRVWIWQETGDCLWSIAKEHYGDPWKWKMIYLANQDTIHDPNIIFPKQILIIPPDE